MAVQRQKSIPPLHVQGVEEAEEAEEADKVAVGEETV